jgi:protein-tyrosine sulfotransferase
MPHDRYHAAAVRLPGWRRNVGTDIRQVDPIFILGVMPRSGTNYLWDLICSHPDCAPAREPIHEDLFLQHAHMLEAYVAAVRRAWDPAWGAFADDLPAKLWGSLGDGLISFLWVQRDRRLVTKSPSVRNLTRFFSLFPRARLLILIRDGRSAVQSAMTTFAWDFDTAAHLWAEGAEEIRQFDRANRDRGLSYRIVRYEDLVDDLQATMAEILDFLDLDHDRFDSEAAARLPVRGSSAFFGAGRATVNWDPVEKDAAFAPKERWRDWDPTLLRRFEWIAGDQLRHFGYQGSPDRPTSVVWPLRQRMLDWRWRSRRFARRAGYWVQRQVPAARRRRAQGRSGSPGS